MTREEAIGYLLGEYVVAHEGNEYEKELNEALDVAIKTLQGDIYCPNCGVRLVPENEYLEPTQTHGRLIDADALYEYITNKVGGVDCAVLLDDEISPTVQADRPHGEWVEREDWNGDSYYDCSVCGESFVLCDGTPSMNLYHFCPNCGADNRGETKCIK